MSIDSPFTVRASDLVEARMLSHLAVQWPSKAARANLSAVADDSHSNLGWNGKHHALVSHHLDAAKHLQLGFSFASQSLVWLVDDRIEDVFNVAEATHAFAQAWVNTCLERSSLQPLTNVDMPYELEAPGSHARFHPLENEVNGLGAWFNYGHAALERLVATNPVGVTTPTVRCWPHHFDLGVLFSLEGGDPETARSIGVGFSPGDENYAEPYFYCSPWPVPDAKTLMELEAPMRWHTDGFVSAVVRAQDLSASTNINEILSDAVIRVKQTIEA